MNKRKKIQELEARVKQLEESVKRMKSFENTIREDYYGRQGLSAYYAGMNPAPIAGTKRLLDALMSHLGLFAEVSEKQFVVEIKNRKDKK